MSESMQRADYGASPEVERKGERERARWSRSHTIWALITLSLLPGFLIATFRDLWEDLPDEARLVTYVVIGILILAAVALIMVGRDSDA